MTEYHIKYKINLSDTHAIFDIVTYIHSVINEVVPASDTTVIQYRNL